MNRSALNLILALLAISTFLCPFAKAATITANSCSQADVQAAVNAASNGDIVQIPAGSATWASPVIMTDKNISVIGAGIGQTKITVSDGTSARAFTITMDGSDSYTDGTSSAGTPVKLVSWRLSSMTITGTTDSDHPVVYVTSVNYDYPVMGWRIDDIQLNFPSTAPCGIALGGMLWGVIDHCQFSGKGIIGIEVHAYYNDEYRAGSTVGGNAGGQAYQGNTAWAMPLDLGSDEAVYVENCTFDYTQMSSVLDIGMGGSCVFRHNNVTGAAFFSHPTESGTIGRGGKKFEIYDNVFTDNGDGTTYPIYLGGTGTGVVFDNTITGFTWYNGVVATEWRATGNGSSPNGYFGECTGTTAGCTGNCRANANGLAAYDGYTEASGWPLLDQVGRGPAVAANWETAIQNGQTLDTLGQPQPSVPVLVWNNGPQQSCSTGSGSPACDGTSGLGSFGAPLNTSYSISAYLSSAAHSNGDVDYCAGGTAMPTKCGNYTNTYKPFTYPYPWPLSSTQSPISAPSGLHLAG